MKNFLNTEEIISALQQRYAVKKFDSNKIISKEIEKTICQILTLSPSSYGLQPYKFLIIKNTALRKKLQEVSFNQPQIVDASFLICFCIKTNINAQHIDRYMEIHSQTTQTPRKDLATYQTTMNQKVDSFSEEAKKNWSAMQIYLALGNLLSSLAILGVDACPIEGFSKDRYDQILNLTEKNLQSIVLAAVGHRSKDDFLQSTKKVRFTDHELIEKI